MEENPINRVEIISLDHPIVVLNQLNNQLDSLKNIVWNNVEIKVKYNIYFTLKGYIAYEKDKNFRLVSDSLLSKELDLGSNDTYFWFWSKRMKPKGLYYAKHEDLLTTNLKTPFNPIWMMEALGVAAIDYNSYEITQYKDQITLLKKDISPTCEEITRVILIDPEELMISGNYIYDKENNIIASAEVKETQIIDGIKIPRIIHIIWHETGIKMELILEEPQANININPLEWQIPNITPQKEIGTND